jgi:hypothetical protein
MLGLLWMAVEEEAPKEAEPNCEPAAGEAQRLPIGEGWAVLKDFDR